MSLIRTGSQGPGSHPVAPQRDDADQAVQPDQRDQPRLPQHNQEVPERPGIAPAHQHFQRHRLERDESVGHLQRDPEDAR